MVLMKVFFKINNDGVIKASQKKVKRIKLHLEWDCVCCFSFAKKFCILSDLWTYETETLRILYDVTKQDAPRLIFFLRSAIIFPKNQTGLKKLQKYEKGI